MSAKISISTNIDEEKSGLGANVESALHYPDTPSNFSP